MRADRVERFLATSNIPGEPILVSDDSLDLTDRTAYKRACTIISTYSSTSTLFGIAYELDCCMERSLLVMLVANEPRGYCECQHNEAL